MNRFKNLRYTRKYACDGYKADSAAIYNAYKYKA